METKELEEKEEKEEEDNGCGEGTKPYEVTYHITGTNKVKFCMPKDGDIMEWLESALTDVRWELVNLDIKILEKKELEHLDD